MLEQAGAERHHIDGLPGDRVGCLDVPVHGGASTWLPGLAGWRIMLGVGGQGLAGGGGSV